MNQLLPFTQVTKHKLNRTEPNRNETKQNQAVEDYICVKIRDNRIRPTPRKQDTDTEIRLRISAVVAGVHKSRLD